MKTFFRYIFTILLLVIIGFFVANFFVSEKIKTLLAEEPSLSYSNLNVNLLTGSFDFEQIKFKDADKEVKIKEIYLTIDLIHYLLNKEIKVGDFDAKELEIKLMLSSEPKTNERMSFEISAIEKINLNDASISFVDENKTIFKASKLNLKAENVNWPLDENYEWLGNETLQIDAKDLRYTMDTLHDLTSESFAFTNQSLSFTNFSIEPKFTRNSYVNHIQTEKDLVDLKSKSIKISRFKLQKKDSLLHVSSNKIEIDSTDFSIYRDKTVADDNTYKPLYSQALRELSLQLKIDSLLISELDITYQELIKQNREPAEIKFNAIHGEVLNIHNSLDAKQSDIKVSAKAEFSKASEIVFKLNFVPDHEQFYLSTRLKQVEDKSINGFFAAAMRMEMDGKIDEIKTSVYGNNTEMNGDFSIAYEKLKLNILKRDGSKNNFASLLSNALLKNNDVDETYQLENIERDTTKSFWNYLWTFHLQGLKKSLL